ncbi:hydroxyacylglutathione hydrolase [Pelagibacteraceae bacterium]|nr:hydroxyacylglutathione hydrolase [Pelagibacteraceae bacterium]
MLNIDIVTCLQDNYSFIVHDTETNTVSVVDPSEFEPIDNFIKGKFNKIDYILNTHHHFDHVGGNLDLKKKYKAKIIGFKNDKKRIPGIDIKLSDNENFRLGSIDFKILFIPGHTSGHVCFYSKNEKVIFTGDTLFSLGCGKVFEGTHLEMLRSLNLIKKLPSDTQIYCGHEYTKKNLDFCIKYEINNRLAEKKKWITSRLNQNRPTIPITVKEELNTNIFLRCGSLEVKKSLRMENSTELEVFKKLRDLKDVF